MYRLGALLHLVHLRLRDTVRPDASISPGAYAIREESPLEGFFLEIKPEHGFGRIESFGRPHRPGEYPDVVNHGVTDILIGILSLHLLVAADAERERKVPDTA